ncbi:MAG: uroporphyrinogen-III C-methyltransferase [Bacteroidota bacterium]
MQPHFTLVGAGPGDPELITLKGIKALQQAQVVLYDALVHPDLLLHAPPSAKRIFVGKRAGQASHSQSQINYLIAAYAHAYGHVVRLKGGDPFIFGRGMEEKLYAERFGIPVRVVPGLSSVNAAPGLQGIPLTQRGVNESFWVITGTTSQRQLSTDLALAARSSATVVILMGTRKLGEIMNLFREQGKHELPVGVIFSASLPNEVAIYGTVESIETAVAATPHEGPGIILVGPTVRQQLTQAPLPSLQESSPVDKYPAS